MTVEATIARARIGLQCAQSAPVAERARLGRVVFDVMQEAREEYASEEGLDFVEIFTALDEIAAEARELF